MNIAYIDLRSTSSPVTVPMTINEHDVHPKEPDMIAPAHLVAAADGREVRFQGLGTRYVVSAEQTGGAFAVVEHALAPRPPRAPTHTPHRADDITHVTVGRLGVQIGDEVLEAGPGDTVVKPRGIAHAFWNPGDEPVRCRGTIPPAGFEH